MGAEVAVGAGASLGMGMIVAVGMVVGADVHPPNKDTVRTYTITRTNLVVFFIPFFSLV